MFKSRIYSLIFWFGTLFIAGTWAQAQNNVLLIDTRSPAEYEEGHIQGAVLIPYDTIEAGVLKLSASKNTPVYLYCGSGRRAEVARERLEYRGYTQVINLGGMSDAEAFFAPVEEQP